MRSSSTIAVRVSSAGRASRASGWWISRGWVGGRGRGVHEGAHSTEGRICPQKIQESRMGDIVAQLVAVSGHRE